MQVRVNQQVLIYGLLVVTMNSDISITFIYKIRAVYQFGELIGSATPSETRWFNFLFIFDMN